MGRVFEDITREHARLLAARGDLAADRVDAWWSADGRHEIDIVGLSGRGIGFVGEAQWSARPLCQGALQGLDGRIAALPGVTPGTLRLLYGRAGCAPALAGRPALRCYSASDLYAD